MDLTPVTKRTAAQTRSQRVAGLARALGIFGLALGLAVVFAFPAWASEQPSQGVWEVLLPKEGASVGGQVSLSGAKGAQRFAAGATVELTVSPQEGWHGCALTLTNELTGQVIPFEGNAAGGKVSFTMPDAPVDVRADFGYGDVAPVLDARLFQTPEQELSQKLGLRVREAASPWPLSLFDGGVREGEAKPTGVMVEVEHQVFDKAVASVGLSRQKFEADEAHYDWEMDTHNLGAIAGDVMLYDTGDPAWYAAYVYPIASDATCVESWGTVRVERAGNGFAEPTFKDFAVTFDAASGLLKVSKDIDDLLSVGSASIVLLETSNEVAHTPLECVIHVEGDGEEPPELATQGCTLSVPALAAPLVELQIAKPGALGNGVAFEDVTFLDASGNEVFTQEPVAGVFDFDNQTGMLRVAGLSPAFYRDLTIKVRRPSTVGAMSQDSSPQIVSLGDIWPEYDGNRFVENMERLEATYRDYANQGLVDYGVWYSTYGANECYLGTYYNSGSMEARAQGPGESMDCSSFLGFAMVQQGAWGNWDSWNAFIENAGLRGEYTYGMFLPSTSGYVAAFSHYANEGTDIPGRGHANLTTEVITGRGETHEEQREDIANQLFARSLENGGTVSKGAPCVFSTNEDFNNGPGGANSDCHALLWWPEPSRPDGQTADGGANCFWSQYVGYHSAGDVRSDGSRVYLGKQNCLSQLCGKKSCRYLFTVSTVSPPEPVYANVELNMAVDLLPDEAKDYSVLGAEFVIAGPDAQNDNALAEWRFEVSRQDDGSFGFTSTGDASAQEHFVPGQTYTIKEVTVPQGLSAEERLTEGWEFTIPANQPADRPYGIGAPSGLPVIYNQVHEDPDAPQQKEPVALYRLYNPHSGEHLWTLDANEYDTSAQNGWRKEGEAFLVDRDGERVYRLFNPYMREGSTHLYTSDLQEITSCCEAGWEFEGIAWTSGGEVPIYRLYNPYDSGRLWTQDRHEYETLGKKGWNQEDIGFYAVG